MRRNGWTRACLIGLILLAGVTTGPCAALAETESAWTVAAEAPTFTPGDTWLTRYSSGLRGVRRFIKQDGPLFVFEVEHAWPAGTKVPGILHLSQDLSIVRMLSRDGVEGRRFEPQSLGLRFPLEMGKEWADECRRFDHGRAVGTFRGKYRVAGLEEILAPAGRFKAFRVEGQTYEVSDPALRWRFTHWYAPDVRAELRVESVEPDGSGSVVELVDFQPAGASRAVFPGMEKFVGRWEGHWKETLLATRLVIEKVERGTASVVYWRGALRFPAFHAPSEQRAEARFLDASTMKLDVWDDVAGRWADITYTLNSDDTLTGKWRSGEFTQNARLERQP